MYGGRKEHKRLFYGNPRKLPKNSLQVAQKAITTTSKTETEGNNAFVQPSSIIQKNVSNNLIIVYKKHGAV